MTPKKLHIEYDLNGEINSITDKQGNSYSLVSIKKKGGKIQILEVEKI